MAERFVLEEYSEILTIYTTFQHLTPLIQSIELYRSNQKNIDCLKVTWLEGKQECIYVDREGWYVFPEKKYPTFESLAMQRSLEFNKKWGEALYEKLKELDNESDN